MGTLRCRSAMNLIGRSYHRSVEAFIYSRMNCPASDQLYYYTFADTRDASRIDTILTVY